MAQLDTSINLNNIDWDAPVPANTQWHTQGGPSPENIVWESQANFAPDMGSLGTPELVSGAGEAVGQAIEAPFIPLRKALEQIHRSIIEPVRKRDITSTSDIPTPGYGAPEAFAPLPSEKSFVTVTELVAAPAYAKLLTQSMKLLSKVGKSAFYKHAPDIFFRKGEAGLPEVLSQERIVELLSTMTGAERAAMARKYPQFRAVLNEMTAGSRQTPQQAPNNITIPAAQAALTGNLREQVTGRDIYSTPQLPQGQGFALRPKVIRRPEPIYDYEGNYYAGQPLKTDPVVDIKSGGKTTFGAPPPKFSIARPKEEKQLEDIAPSTIVKQFGGFSLSKKELKQFEPEERRKLFPFLRKGAIGPDKLLQSLKESYPGHFIHYESDYDFLRSIVDGDIYKKINRSELNPDEEEYLRQEMLKYFDDKLQEDFDRFVENNPDYVDTDNVDWDSLPF